MNEELNLKIAKWLGFKLAKAPSDDGFYYFAIDGMGHPANFTYSLDACFEYIVPKFGGLYDFRLHNCTEGYYFNVSRPYGCDYFAYEKTPALAFCRAVEKLIDERT